MDALNNWIILFSFGFSCEKKTLPVFLGLSEMLTETVMLEYKKGAFHPVDYFSTVHTVKCYDQPCSSANRKRITFLVKPLQNPHSSHNISNKFSR